MYTPGSCPYWFASVPPCPKNWGGWNLKRNGEFWHVIKCLMYLKPKIVWAEVYSWEVEALCLELEPTEQRSKLDVTLDWRREQGTWNSKMGIWMLAQFHELPTHKQTILSLSFLTKKREVPLVCQSQDKLRKHTWKASKTMAVSVTILHK